MRAELVTSVISLASFLVARFSWWLLSSCSLLKAACPEWFPDKVRAGPGVPPPAFFSEGYAFDISSFISEGADPTTVSIHPLPIAQSTRLFAFWSSLRSFWMSSPSWDVAAVLHLGHYSVVAYICFVSLWCDVCIFSRMVRLESSLLMKLPLLFQVTKGHSIITEYCSLVIDRSYCILTCLLGLAELKAFDTSVFQVWGQNPAAHLRKLSSFVLTPHQEFYIYVNFKLCLGSYSADMSELFMPVDSPCVLENKNRLRTLCFRS
jgi:hypothetical protein